MSNKYSKLNIDKDKLAGWINLWCEKNLQNGFNITENDTKDCSSVKK